MARFVHITAQKNIRGIRRAGIKAAPLGTDARNGIYAMPVVPDFYRSHQWVRELKRGGQRQMYGIYFYLPDDADILIGHYNQPQIPMQAAEAVAVLMRAPDVQGYEVVIPHAIAARDIVAVRPLPHIGWRYSPVAHGRRPCGCPVCLGRGEIKSQRIRAAYDAEN